MHKIQKQNLSSIIIDRIVDLILKGDWKVGMKLPNEPEMALSFNVSRNVMREALKILEHYGVLGSKAGIGTFVEENAATSISNMHFFNDLKNNLTIGMILETRLIIEPQLAYYAASRCDEEGIVHLKKIAHEIHNKIASEPAVPSNDFHFHLTVAQYSKNVVCKDLLNSLLSELSSSEYAKFNEYSSRKMMETDSNDHLDIIQAIVDRQPKVARELMKKHINNRIETIRKAFPGTSL